MPLPVADKGMALFPQPQLLQDYANAGLQKLNAARWIRFNPRWPAAHGRSNPSVSTMSSRAHAAAPPFQIEPAALGFDLVFSFFGHISSISPLVPENVKLLRSLTQLVEKAHLGWTFSSKFQLFHSVECLAELIAADGAGNAHMPLARFAECRTVCDDHMCLFKQLGAERCRVELCFPYRREEIKRSVRLVKLKIRYAPYPLGGIKHPLTVFSYIASADILAIVQSLYCRTL